MKSLWQIRSTAVMHDKNIKDISDDGNDRQNQTKGYLKDSEIQQSSNGQLQNEKEEEKEEGDENGKGKYSSLFSSLSSSSSTVITTKGKNKKNSLLGYSYNHKHHNNNVNESSVQNHKQSHSSTSIVVDRKQKKSFFQKGFHKLKKTKIKRKSENLIENNTDNNSDDVLINQKESDNSLFNIPKTDENWIRIKVTYDDDDDDNKDFDDDSIDEDSSENIEYRDYKGLDIPDELLRKRISKNCYDSVNNPRKSVQDFSRRDWIHNEYPTEFNDTTKTTTTTTTTTPTPNKSGTKLKTSKNIYHELNAHNNIQNEKMGVNCVKLQKNYMRKHSVSPMGCNKTTITKNHDDNERQRNSNCNCNDKIYHANKCGTDKTDNVIMVQSKNKKFSQIPVIRVYSEGIFDSTGPSNTIELDNILHQRNNANSKDDDQLTIIKSSSQLIPSSSTMTTISDRRNSEPLTPNKMQNTQFTTSDANSNDNLDNTSFRKSQNFLKNFSGSVQNLMNFVKIKTTVTTITTNNNRNSEIKLNSKKCVSENNLTNLPESKLNKKIGKFSSKSTYDLNYCPSVLYNRKQIADLNRTNQKSDKLLSVNLRNLKKRFSLNLTKSRSSKLKDGNQDTFQDLDGGFFEKFGSLLRQKSQLEESHYITPLAPLPEEETCVEGAVAELCTIKETENDSGIGISHESDNEQEQDPRVKHESFIEGVVGMNIDELYEEILYEILHNLGCVASEDNDMSQNSLFEYVQDAFKIPNDKHDEMLQSAQSKEPPEIRLNVEVIKAENLLPKDSNGFSDPFVTLYLESCSTHRYNTSVKSETLNPLWEEHFSLPIPDNPNNEVLIVEVWDFDAAETVGEKMNKLFEVKGIRGLRKLMKEIAVTASTGKHDNELIGRTAIPLRTIPASGIKVWYSLEKGSKTRTRGSVLIRMNFSAEKNNKVAAQEHRHLLRILLMHELETSKVAPYWWNGKFSTQGEAVLTQHSAQSGLSQIECALAEWSVFSNVHQDHPLSFSLFNSILDKILPTLQALPSQGDEIKLFWEGARKLLPSCFSIIRKLRKKTTGDKHCVKMLTEVLDIISKIESLQPPNDFDLLPSQIYGWTVRDDDTVPCTDLRNTLRDAVNTGAAEWFEHIDEGSGDSNASEEDKLRHLIKLIQLIRSDLQKAVEYYDKTFQQKMHFLYAQTLYSFYEKKLAEKIQPVVDEVCRNIKRLDISEDRFEKLPEHEEINMGTTLFELYLVIKRFATLGSALCPDEDLNINLYYDWFTPGVTHWLDISVYKAMTRIEKAIDLDKLIPVDETVKYSSSAVDTLAIFYQIKVFWQQLEWPDIVGAYTFVAKIVDDICRCCVFYANRMSKRVEELRMHENQQRFEVTREWCLAINNIDYIRQSLSPFIKELDVDNIITRLSDIRSSLEAERCAETLKNVIDNAIDTERNKILELIEIVARKMSPAMRRFLIEGAEILHEDSNSMERLMMYLEESLKTLYMELNEINFNRMLDAIWNELSVILYELVQSNLDKRRPPAFFSNLRDTLHVMVNSFKLQQNSDQSSDRETLEHIERLLELHAYETADLIHQYYIERLNDQKNMKEMPYGQLTVKANFVDNILQLEIMNARNLIPMDSNGTCDSFVKVHFMPVDKFIGIASPKTSVQNKTLYPLYDEKFSISLSHEQRALSDAIIVFSIKDKDLFGMSNQYIAECYLSFADVENSNNEQIHLTLSRPEYKDTDCLRALEYRQGDKQAKEFIKKLKQKAY